MADDDLFDTADDEQDLREFEQLREALFAKISEFMDEHDLDETVMSGLLIEAAAAMQQVDYFMSTAKPSEGGLKTELDRFHRTVGELIRTMKKSAKDSLAEFRATMAENPDADSSPD